MTSSACSFPRKVDSFSEIWRSRSLFGNVCTDKKKHLMFFEKCLHPVQVKIIEREKPYLAVVAESRRIKNRSLKFREIRINPGENQGRIIWLKHAVVSRLSPYFDKIFGNIKTLCHKWHECMGSRENVRIVFGKNLPEIDTRHLFEVRIEQCDFFSGTPCQRLTISLFLPRPLA